MRNIADLQKRRKIVQERFSSLLAAIKDYNLKDHLETIKKNVQEHTPADTLFPGRTHILLIDDLTYITRTVSYMLEKENYMVSVAKSSTEGITQFMNTLPDLVITDLRLPDFNGLILSKLIRKLDENVPIIFITANDLDPEIGLELDFDIKNFDLEENNMSLLLKPIQKEKILETIASYLGSPNSKKKQKPK